MLEFGRRRSCRVAVSVPIRVFGTDYRGRDFTEEANTLVVNLQGAKIRMTHQLIPEAEIRLVSHATGRDSVFRVVSKLRSPDLEFTYWGVENLNPNENIWGVEIPALETGDQAKVRVLIECPTCSAREILHVEETPLAAIQEKGGVERTCNACDSTGLWKLLPFHEA